LRLVLVRDRAVRQDHAVLAACLDGHWLILDNRRSELIADSDASSLTPLFAINHRGVQLFAAPSRSAYRLLAKSRQRRRRQATVMSGNGAVWTCPTVALRN